MFPIWLQRIFRRFLSKESSEVDKKIEYARPPHPVVNMFFTILARIELLMSALGFNLPFGTSLIGVARVRSISLEK